MDSLQVLNIELEHAGQRRRLRARRVTHPIEDLGTQRRPDAILTFNLKRDLAFEPFVGFLEIRPGSPRAGGTP